jgi:hypothetical protein
MDLGFSIEALAVLCSLCSLGNYVGLSALDNRLHRRQPFQLLALSLALVNACFLFMVCRDSTYYQLALLMPVSWVPYVLTLGLLLYELCYVMDRLLNWYPCWR